MRTRRMYLPACRSAYGDIIRAFGPMAVRKGLDILLSAWTSSHNRWVSRTNSGSWGRGMAIL